MTVLRLLARRGCCRPSSGEFPIEEVVLLSDVKNLPAVDYLPSGQTPSQGAPHPGRPVAARDIGSAERPGHGIARSQHPDLAAEGTPMPPAMWKGGR